MNGFESKLAPLMEAMITFKEALGYSRVSYEGTLLNLDRFCLRHYPSDTCLTRDIVLKWMEKRPNEHIRGITARSCVIRQLGKYLRAMGQEAYILPPEFVGGKSTFVPYLFTDDELCALFSAVDAVKPTYNGSRNHMILPVILRLIYTCGLRPNEGRELKCRNVNLETGEVFITGTKRHKERIVVMSDNMLALCREYDTQRMIFSAGSEYFFPHPNGGAHARSWLSYQINMCWRHAHPGKDPKSLPAVRAYDLRHRFASATLNRWLDEKKDLYAMLPYLRTYMGHSTLSATAYYIHLLPETLVKSAGIDWGMLESAIPEVNTWAE